VRELSEELHPLIEKKYMDGPISDEELPECIAEWTAERLGEDEDRPARDASSMLEAEEPTPHTSILPTARLTPAI
jgi:hypothetical protein